MSDLILVSHRTTAEGGTLAKDITAGDVVNTPEAGKLKVGEVRRYMSEGTPMIVLDFPSFPGFASYRAMMPESTEVDVEPMAEAGAMSTSDGLGA